MTALKPSCREPMTPSSIGARLCRRGRPRCLLARRGKRVLALDRGAVRRAIRSRRTR